MEIREITRPYLERLSREFNKSVNLLMLDRLRMVFIERIRVPGVRDFHISIGRQYRYTIRLREKWYSHT